MDYARKNRQEFISNYQNNRLQYLGFRQGQAGIMFGAMIIIYAIGWLYTK